HRINSLKYFGEEFGLNDLDVTLLSAEEVNRLLVKKHESLGAKSHATFDSSLAAFRWLYEFLSEKGYTNTNYLQDFKIKRPRLIKAEKNIRSYYEDCEMDFIYERY